MALKFPVRYQTQLKYILPQFSSLQHCRAIHVPPSGPRRSITSASWDVKPPRRPASNSNNNNNPHRDLEKMPMVSLLRGIVMYAAMSRPYLMDTASAMVRKNIHLLTGNPVLRFFLDKIFYAHFCAGATEAEIKRTVGGLRNLGFKGVIINYAREVDLSTTKTVQASTAERLAAHQAHVAEWLDGSLRGVKYSNAGDYVALKFTGAGAECVRMLEAGEAPDAVMAQALDEICKTAKVRGVRLLFDAEHHVQQKGIDAWTMDLMEKYNKSGDLVVYNTYQMYLKKSTATLAKHLERAQSANFPLGVKLVRGAYLDSDPRHLIHNTKEETDRAYNDAAVMLATQHIRNPSGPRVGIVLATHNAESVNLMRDLRQEQVQNGMPLAEVDYAQLMGMADELSLSLTQKRPDIDEENIQVFKYIVWGTHEECMMYLLRRADENRDAVDRSLQSRRALWSELRQRLFL
ncbi:proline dehydrogenase [Onygenales sp. PD_12]|nr:proline dehydrogenase [Emmonsiellopsis sp. PD_33]KAK2789880.1 proline dehydrogenase [Onygenales sp. PD_12]